MAGRRVVVTGIGTINPLGHSIEEYFTNLENGVSAATEITLFDATKFRSRMACEVKDYDWSRYFDRKEVRKYDRFAQWAMISADEALRDAGVVDNDLIDKERVGVVWGSGTGGTTTFYEESKGYIEGNYTPRFSPFFVPRMVVDLAAGFISIKYGFMGPNYSTVSACASSNHAMIDALNLIRWGKADMIVTGGSEASINDPGVGSFCGMQALSTRNDDPQHASRPFDKDRDGFVIGEGGGAQIGRGPAEPPGFLRLSDRYRHGHGPGQCGHFGHRCGIPMELSDEYRHLRRLLGQCYADRPKLGCRRSPNHSPDHRSGPLCRYGHWSAVYPAGPAFSGPDDVPLYK